MNFNDKIHTISTNLGNILTLSNYFLSYLENADYLICIISRQFQIWEMACMHFLYDEGPRTDNLL